MVSKASRLFMGLLLQESLTGFFFAAVPDLAGLLEKAEYCHPEHFLTFGMTYSKLPSSTELHYNLP